MIILIFHVSRQIEKVMQLLGFGNFFVLFFVSSLCFETIVICHNLGHSSLGVSLCAFLPSAIQVNTVVELQI